jgi:hypothetical protein
MNPNFQHELFSQFPQLYRHRILPDTESRMCEGFCCGDGWYKLLYGLSETIDRICQQYNLRGETYPTVFQVKEKYGGLRFYIDTHKKTPKAAYLAIREAVHYIEIKSEETCEVCGAKGRIVEVRNWIFTRCDQHIPAE